MKKVFFNLFMATAVAVALSACANKGGDATADGETADSTAAAVESGEGAAEAGPVFPWKFPNGSLKNAKSGQLVLAPINYYRVLDKGEDLLTSNVNLYKAVLDEVGDKFSTLRSYDKEHVYPNALIIPFPEGQQAKVGDILFTFSATECWSRAIVTDASNPAQPKVTFFDIRYSNDAANPGPGEKEMNTELAENSFIVVKDGELCVGAQVAKKEGRDYKQYCVLAVSGDKLLISDFARGVKDAVKSEVTLIPFNEDIKVGDEVWSTFAGKYSSGSTVTKVDKKNGLVTVKNSFGEEELKPVTEVTKVLQ